jgi:hypothetical protein
VPFLNVPNDPADGGKPNAPFIAFTSPFTLYTIMQKIQLLIVLVLTLSLVGCGPKGLQTYFVEGIVTLDGKPLDGAIVTFTPAERTAENMTAGGQTNGEGKYT